MKCFLIQFELKDREKLRTDAGNSGSRRRKVPAEEEYCRHQEEGGIIPSEAIGGLYSRVFLRDFLLRGGVVDLMPTHSAPKQW